MVLTHQPTHAVVDNTIQKNENTCAIKEYFTLPTPTEVLAVFSRVKLDNHGAFTFTYE